MAGANLGGVPAVASAAPQPSCVCVRVALRVRAQCALCRKHHEASKLLELALVSRGTAGHLPSVGVPCRVNAHTTHQRVVCECRCRVNAHTTHQR
eukprot:913946-Rhodomonas_salina.1